MPYKKTNEANKSNSPRGRKKAEEIKPKVSKSTFTLDIKPKELVEDINKEEVEKALEKVANTPAIDLKHSEQPVKETVTVVNKLKESTSEEKNAVNTEAEKNEEVKKPRFIPNRKMKKMDKSKRRLTNRDVYGSDQMGMIYDF